VIARDGARDVQLKTKKEGRMVYTYPYEMIDGHIIVTSDDGKVCLIDTGSHVSVGGSEHLLFAGARYVLQPSLLGKAACELPGPIGVRIDVLAGADILNHYDMLIDPVRQVLEFSDAEHDLEGEAIHVELLSGVPMLEADVGGNRIKVFFDTGAPVSYACEERLQAFPRVGTANDFYITCGGFQTALHRVPVTLGNRNFSLDIGVLPQDLQDKLLAVGVEGIVGTAILMYFMVVYMPRRRRLILVARRQDL
jgi:hypothetical protein